LAAGTSFAQEASCTDCHNDTTIITGKQLAWEGSTHGNGTAAAYAGGRGSCTACHSGASFSGAIAAGLPVQDFGDVVDVTRQDCRACHQIHTSYTGADWALEATDPVMLYAFDASTDALFNGGKGNLCANCHQPRRAIAAADPNDNIYVSSSHWGPHHGPQSAMLLGIGGAGDVEGEASLHASLVEDTCVTCHVGEGMSHSFAAVDASCVACHGEDDLGAAQDAVDVKIAELGDLLLAAGLLSADKEWEIGEDGVNVEVVHGYHPVRGWYPAAQAQALWNYILIEVEDGSHGTHNMAYTVALLDASIAAMQ
ncbi:MAG: hypothetical protein HQ515_22860, partial [Phycisphaeraceae bacterium]|nr:hypothetical protein [Phycisphaeraceae bacterium]